MKKILNCILNREFSEVIFNPLSSLSIKPYWINFSCSDLLNHACSNRFLVQIVEDKNIWCKHLRWMDLVEILPLHLCFKLCMRGPSLLWCVPVINTLPTIHEWLAIIYIFLMWLTYNFSQQYLYIIQQTGDKNIQTYDIKDVYLIKNQIFRTNIQGNV